MAGNPKTVTKNMVSSNQQPIGGVLNPQLRYIRFFQLKFLTQAVR